MSKLTKALTAAAGNAGAGALYVEDVFSTYLYKGNSSTQTITNGADLDGEGGLVWIKARDRGTSHYFFDTERGVGNYLRSNSNSNSSYDADMLTAFNSNGFSLGADTKSNATPYNYASWTFRKAEKFFDVVTYTGSNGQAVAHNLGSVPKVIMIKAISGTYSTNDWMVYHANVGAPFLNLNDSGQALGNFWTTSITDTHFSPPGNTSTNGNGTTYVAYLFASDAGGFGDDGSESIIKCGSYTGTGAVDTLSIELGFEPQWIMVKSTTTDQSWYMQDIMREMPVGSSGKTLTPDTSAVESTTKRWFYPTATGVRAYDNEIEYNQSGQTYIYIAIRRPMKTPESGTEVFAVDDRAAATPAFVSDFPVDLYWTRAKTGGNFSDYARLRGNKYLQHDGTNAETDGGAFFDSNTGVGSSGSASTNNLAWMFKRATGFFDVVAYTSTTSAVNHNLGVSPELVIYKSRTAGTWYAMVATDGFGELNSSGAWGGAGNGSGLGINLANATATTITGAGNLYGNGVSMVTYLFATVAGVSKVGSYTGTGNNLNVDCGFSAGARFILIKRTNSTGDWYVYDYFRGIVSGNDPYLLLNTGTGEVTSTDYIDPLSSGFTVTSSAPAALNASGGSYIFLAIA